MSASSDTYVENTPAGPRATADAASITGWGADLDPANRPGYPRERTPPRLEGVHWDSLAPQRASVEILHSSERPGLTPLYGTPNPPKGLSGVLRRIAFKFSENDLRHWLILLFADRINVGEGLIEDVVHGHVPNPYAEMGGNAELRLNPKGAARKAVIGVVLTVAVVHLLTRKR